MRFVDLDRAQLTERQRETYDRITNSPRQGVRGPFVAWLRSPVFADCAERMGNYLRFESSLAKSIIELAILMVAKRWQATFVWNSHRALALDAGLPEGIIEAMRRGQLPPFHDHASEVAYKFLVELLDNRRVSDQTWLDAINEFGDQGVVDLLGVTGYYGMVAMTVIAIDLGADLPDAFSSGASVRADTSR